MPDERPRSSALVAARKTATRRIMEVCGTPLTLFNGRVGACYVKCYDDVSARARQQGRGAMPRNYGMRLFGPRPAEGRLPASFPSCRSTQVIYSASCVLRGPWSADDGVDAGAH